MEKSLDLLREEEARGELIDDIHHKEDAVYRRRGRAAAGPPGLDLIGCVDGMQGKPLDEQEILTEAGEPAPGPRLLCRGGLFPMGGPLDAGAAPAGGGGGGGEGGGAPAARGWAAPQKGPGIPGFGSGDLEFPYRLVVRPLLHIVLAHVQADEVGGAVAGEDGFQQYAAFIIPPLGIQVEGPCKYPAARGGLEYLDIIPFGVEHVETAVRILPHAGGEIEQAHPFAPGRVAAETAKEMPLPVHDSDIARVVHHQHPPVVGDEEVAGGAEGGR